LLIPTSSNVIMENTTGKAKVATSTKPNKMKQKFVPRDYKGLSKDDLRQELRKRGIKISGKKADLVCIKFKIMFIRH